jgi:6-pyruvoyltetrahydropterin/6-carboxytetrahydropterin synthase
MDEDEYLIQIFVDFRSGHRLMDYVGLCSNPHGEFYTATFIFKYNFLDKAAIAIDFGPIKQKIKKWIDENFDHSYLCREDDFVGKFLKENNFRVYMLKENPSAEYLAKFLYNLVKEWNNNLIEVHIQESKPDAIAKYYITQKKNGGGTYGI